MSRRRRIVRACGLFACSVFALLLWSKLKLVSGIPRTAYANPDERAQPEAALRPQGGTQAGPAAREASVAEDHRAR